MSSQSVKTSTTALTPVSASSADEGDLSPVRHRYDIVYFFEVVDGNPNGDPDNSGAPRMDNATQQGLMSSNRLKRNVRDRVALVNAGKPGFQLYIANNEILADKKNAAYDALGLTEELVTVQAKSGKDKTVMKKRRGTDAIFQVSQYMTRTYWDVRALGAAMDMGTSAGTVRGPCQITDARSINKIDPMTLSITRCADEKLVPEKAGVNRTMGRREIVPYGLFRAHVFIDPNSAALTGFSNADKAALRDALNNMFDTSRSACRGTMTVRGIYAFRHENRFGNAQAGRLFDRVTVTQNAEEPRCFADFEVRIDSENLPAGITLEDWLD